MRGSALRQAKPLFRARPEALVVRRRRVHISATPAASVGDGSELAPRDSTVDIGAPDAQFEVLGSPYSLLSASLAASQTLYTRRGTLVGVTGKPDNAVSTLKTLSPLARLPLGISFLYQKISSASPITCLIATRSPITSFTTVRLDGTTDWMIAQRQGLLAWTGQTMTFTSSANYGLSLAHWGQTRVTGRGLLALTGAGQIYQVHVRAGEEYVAHPANVLAYSINRNPPNPFRFKSSVLRLEVPGMGWLSRYVPDINFFKVLSETDSWKRVKRATHVIRTWSRRTIWGDRLFLRFHGPTTVLLSTRASRVADVLSSQEVNEIANVEPGALTPKVTLNEKSLAEREAEEKSRPPLSKGPTMTFASVQGGEVKFEDTQKKVTEELKDRAEQSKS